MPQNGAATQSCNNDSPDPFGRVAVVGGGAWGTALALIAHAAERQVSLWIREPSAVEQVRRDRRNPFLPQFEIPDAIAVSDDLAASLANADLVLLVVPSQFLRAMAREVQKILPPDVPVVLCSKGIELKTGLLMTQVVAAEMPGRAQAVLSGPSFAEEAAAGQPTAVTVAIDPRQGGGLLVPGNLASRVAVTMSTMSFRPYLSDDQTGVEGGGAVKNVLAIACGIAAGRGLGANPRAAIITRGLAEIKRLALALGGQPETVTGLAGIGDLALTCSSEQSRNFTFGKSLGEGRSVDEALAGKSAVVEGVANAEAVAELAARLDVEMPICATVNAILRHGLPIDEAIAELLTRPLRAELRAFEERVKVPHPQAVDTDSEALAP